MDRVGIDAGTADGNISRLIDISCVGRVRVAVGGVAGVGLDGGMAAGWGRTADLAAGVGSGYYSSFLYRLYL